MKGIYSHSLLILTVFSLFGLLLTFGCHKDDNPVRPNGNGNETITWEQTNSPFGGRAFSLVINSHGDIFAGAAGVFYSADNGNNWSQTGLTDLTISSMAVNSLGHLFAGTSLGVFRSRDNGDTWTQVNNGLTNTRVEALATANDVILVGTNRGGIFRSEHNGDSWIQSGIENGFIWSFAVNDKGDVFAGASNGIYLSTDTGVTWTKVLSAAIDTINSHKR